MRLFSSLILSTVALTTLLQLHAPAARAASLVETIGEPGTTNAFSGRLFSDGPGAVYFNPTLLLGQKKSFATGVVFLNQQLSINLRAKPAQYDIPQSIFDSIPVDPDSPSFRPLPTDLLRRRRGSHDPSGSMQYLTLGTVLSFAKGNVAFGFFGILPVKAFQVQSPFYVDEREQYFTNSLHYELFEDRLESNVISFAIAGKINRWFWLGAGLTMNQSATTTSEIYMPDASEQEVSYLNSNIKVVTTLIPHFAATTLIGEKGLFTVTLHLPGENKTKGFSDIQFYNYHNQSGDEATIQQFTLVYAWEPLRFATGLSWDFGAEDRKVTLGGNLQWAQWSNYVDRHGEKPVDDWNDTLTITVGAKARLGKHKFGLDAQFVPTPVPLQEGRSNYVDNNRLGFAAGYACDFSVMGQRVSGGISAQFLYLFPRAHAKNPNHSNPLIDEFVDSKDILTDEFMPESSGFQTNNPGYPGFETKGWIASVGLWIKMFW